MELVRLTADAPPAKVSVQSLRGMPSPDLATVDLESGILALGSSQSSSLRLFALFVLGRSWLGFILQVGVLTHANCQGR